VNTRDLYATDKDAAPKAANESRPPELTWPQVRAFLQAHPEHFAHDSELQEVLGLKPTGPNVVDFGRAALARLEAVAKRETGARKAIEQVARANFAAQAQTHAAVIDLLESRNHTDLARRLNDASQNRFGLVCGIIALEKPGGVPHGWRPIEESVVDMLLGQDGLSRLGEEHGNEGMFGELSEKVQSSALVRLALWSNARPALVAFGSPDPDGFSHDMGAELVAFVARVVERTAERWPIL
jgi:uncharacterized protein YigA (DUF484 family)